MTKLNNTSSDGGDLDKGPDAGLGDLDESLLDGVTGGAEDRPEQAPLPPWRRIPTP